MNWINQMNNWYENENNNFWWLEADIKMVLEKKSIDDIIEIILETPENTDIYLNYFFFVNLYLSRQFYWYVWNFLLDNWELDIEKVDEFKNCVFALFENTDQWVINISKLADNKDEMQKFLLEKSIASAWNPEKFWLSVFDSGSLKISEFMDAMWYDMDMKEKQEAILSFQTFLREQVDKYWADLIRILKS